MGDDDEHTVEMITAYREIIAQLIEKHHGRVVDAPGDNDIQAAETCRLNQYSFIFG